MSLQTFLPTTKTVGSQELLTEVGFVSLFDNYYKKKLQSLPCPETKEKENSRQNKKNIFEKVSSSSSSFSSSFFPTQPLWVGQMINNCRG